jgi:hypothetical protein
LRKEIRNEKQRLRHALPRLPSVSSRDKLRRTEYCTKLGEGGVLTYGVLR